MIYSASILPITARLSWGRAVTPGPLLTPVNVAAAVDAQSYRTRDQELAYRDLIVGSLLAQISLAVGDVWQFSPSFPQIPVAVSGNLAYSGVDAPAGVSAPGSVTHVTNSSVPADAITADQGLYARDLVLHDALANAAKVLVNNPVPPLVPSMPPSEAWSLAEGLAKQLACVGFNLPLNVALFKDPDVNLAAIDNNLAAYVCALQLALADVFENAGRLLVQAPGTEPEVYALSSSTDAQRVWSAFPLLPGGRLQIVYNRVQRTVSWLAEDPIASMPAPQSLAFPVATGTLDVVAEIPPQADAEFYRQKSARLLTRPYVDRVVFQTQQPELYLTTGGLYQPTSVLIPVPATANFSLPIIVPSGCVRVGLSVLPSNVITVLGFLNDARTANGTGVTLLPSVTVNFTVPLPAGVVLLNLSLTDLTAMTPAFSMAITANNALVFDGAFTFNQAPGTSVATQAFQINSAGGNVTIGVTWLGGAGSPTINSLTLLLPLALNAGITYSLALQLGPNQITSPVFLSGVVGRADVVWFDTLVPTQVTAPNLAVSWSGGSGAALYVLAYDLRVFDIKSTLPSAASYEPHKITLLDRALTSVTAAYAATLATGQLTALVPGTPWDTAANAAWLGAIQLGGETRLLEAFQLAGPGDIGRPALLPGGLELVADVPTMTLPPARQGPVLQVMQAWMLPAGPRVAGPDFWPAPSPGCASSGDITAITVSADFVSAFSSPCTPTLGTAYVAGLTATSHLVGSPDGHAYQAYTIANAGPGGGTVQQTVDLVASLTGLQLNVTYSLTINTSQQPVAGGGSTPGTIVMSVFATAATMDIPVPTVIAPTGQQVTILSAILS